MSLNTTKIQDDSLDLYYARMSASLGDKERVLPYVTGQRVLDVGCGSGDLVNFLVDQGFDAYGLDASPESVDRCDNVNVRLGFADEIVEIFGEKYFDTIICSSVFHEVFSYGNRWDEPGQLSSLVNTLTSIRKALVPGGQLVVRDGVKPDSVGTVRMRVDNESEVFKFLDASPFTKSGPDRSITLTKVEDNVFEGTLSSVMEFMFTYTWGVSAFHREVQEYYGIFNLDDYATFVEGHGFINTSREEYLQPGYESHLVGKVSIDAPFPSSNAIWVYKRA